MKIPFIALLCSASLLTAQDEFQAEFRVAYQQVEVAVEDYKSAFIFDDLGEAEREKLSAAIDASQAAWVDWASKEAALHGKISAGGQGELEREEEMVWLISAYAARYAQLTENLPGSADLPTPPAPGTAMISPKRGSQLRKDLCNALRPTIAQETNVGHPIFVISTLKVCGDWAFFNCVPKNKNGLDIDWSKTAHTELAEGEIDELVVALLAKDADGNWQMVDHGVGASDVWWLAWVEKYGIPQKMLF